MKTSHSSNPSQPGGSPSGTPRFACESLLWIGDPGHPDVAPAWRVCQRGCDSISMRQSIAESLAAPPRQPPTHVLVAQTTRHERGMQAIDGPEIAALRSQFADATTLVIRGELVAPTVRLPPQSGATAQSGAPPWVESIPLSAAPDYLPHWLAPEAIVARRLLPVVVVAARYAFAESLIDSLAMLCSGLGTDEPLVQWQRDLTPRSARGFATVLWDESTAAPQSTEQWRQRRGIAPQSRHVWVTGMATTQQRSRAVDQGADQVLDKPGRLECLQTSVRWA
ncbi:hypothetical protein [Allorhodopirellula solitaria]|uniref:Uncharacterized protein n=1 Tax=Allorhodopirellula solitaria TaxID=2527987 RepID=A0A5C5XQT4_9BACT|nr:hypothetical protein [Allorhodopirellula solitaria]TWT64861.1 hypothetical protein CA85_36460 [Allorhodopirellula solitaria]